MSLRTVSPLINTSSVPQPESTPIHPSAYICTFFLMMVWVVLNKLAWTGLSVDIKIHGHHLIGPLGGVWLQTIIHRRIFLLLFFYTIQSFLCFSEEFLSPGVYMHQNGAQRSNKSSLQITPLFAMVVREREALVMGPQSWHHMWGQWKHLVLGVEACFSPLHHDWLQQWLRALNEDQTAHIRLRSPYGNLWSSVCVCV